MCPETVALKKSKMAGEALSVLVFLFLLQPIVSDHRSEIEPVAKSWWFIKCMNHCISTKQEFGESYHFT